MSLEIWIRIRIRTLDSDDSDKALKELQCSDNVSPTHDIAVNVIVVDTCMPSKVH